MPFQFAIIVGFLYEILKIAFCIFIIVSVIKITNLLNLILINLEKSQNVKNK